MEENLQAIRTEVESLDNTVGWQALFSAIRNESSSYDYPCAEARQPLNKMLNRYRDVSPFDHCRVILQNNGPCNYINASFVKVPKAGRNYILTQGALPQTAGHFWLMVWEQKSKAVLMLNKVIEKNQIKCHQYWPVGQNDRISRNGDNTNATMDFQDVGLRVHLLTEKEFRHFVERILVIEEVATGNRREILQFHYTTWPDFGVPSTARAFLHFLQAVRDSGALESDVGPPVVHCSAGIGRSGTFCLADSCLLMMEQGIRVNVKEVLLEMRKYRMGLIQTADQLRFSYLAILEGAQQLAEGNTKFMPDEDNGPFINGQKNMKEENEGIPLAPPRSASLPPSRIMNKDEGYRRMIEEGLASRPLPDIPTSSEDESSEDDELVDESESASDEDTSTSKSYGLLIDVRNNPPELPIPDDVETLPVTPMTPSPSDNPPSPITESSSSMPESSDVMLGNSYHKTNGVDEATLRRRAKTEATMDKLRDIKARQKEAEFYQRAYRSPISKRRKTKEHDSCGKSKSKSTSND